MHAPMPHKPYWARRFNAILFLWMNNSMDIDVCSVYIYPFIYKNRKLWFLTLSEVLNPTSFGIFPIKDMQTPPPSLLISLLWMMGSVLYSVGKIKNKFSELYFSSYHQKLGWWRHKNDSKKLKFGFSLYSADCQSFIQIKKIYKKNWFWRKSMMVTMQIQIQFLFKVVKFTWKIWNQVWLPTSFIRHWSGQQEFIIYSESRRFWSLILVSISAFNLLFLFLSPRKSINHLCQTFKWKT